MAKVFISYSWEDSEHQEWVKKFASDLRNIGIESRLDKWHLEAGDRLPLFMEQEIRENDFILIVCTPKYKEKSDKREGGVGYEGDIITSELFNIGNHKKYIPILRKGSWIESAPTSLASKYYFDLSNDVDSKQYKDMFFDLCAYILDIKEDIPPVAKVPVEKLKNFKNGTRNQSSFTPIKIIKVLIDEVTIPKMDGSRGSALYKIPFELSNNPNETWRTIFIEKWNHPSQFTSMHRPGIASVIGKQIILNGTTIDEVKKYHRDTLVLCINETNQLCSQIEQKEKAKELDKRIKENQHYDNVRNTAEELSFD